MSPVTRRGFTLAELLVALVLLGIVTTGIYRVLVNNQRIYSAQTQRIDLQENIRAAMAILPAEFRQLDAADGDIDSMSATAITIRAFRQLGIVCSPPLLGGSLSGVKIILRTPLYSAVRDFNASTDSILVYYEGDESTRSDDGWVVGGITATPASGTCLDGTSAELLITTLFLNGALNPPQVNVNGAIPNGVPLYGFETVTYKLYPYTDGFSYVGIQNSSGTHRLIGPVLPSNGLTLTYYDSTGAVTAVRTNVRAIGITLRAQTQQRIRQANSSLAYKVDSVSTRVTLRNNPRF